MAWRVIAHNPGPESYEFPCETLEEAVAICKTEIEKGRTVEIRDPEGRLVGPDGKPQK